MNRCDMGVGCEPERCSLHEMRADIFERRDALTVDLIGYNMERELTSIMDMQFPADQMTEYEYGWRDAMAETKDHAAKARDSGIAIGLAIGAAIATVTYAIAVLAS